MEVGYGGRRRETQSGFEEVEEGRAEDNPGNYAEGKAGAAAELFL